MAVSIGAPCGANNNTKKHDQRRETIKSEDTASSHASKQQLYKNILKAGKQREKGKDPWWVQSPGARLRQTVSYPYIRFAAQWFFKH